MHPQIGAEAATVSKKDKASSRGWLEVSIDCTMPTSPVLRKDTFNFGSLQDTLPSSPTSKPSKLMRLCHNATFIDKILI